MTELMTASHQHMTRPSDERFPSLPALAAYTAAVRANTRRKQIANRGLTVLPSTIDPIDIVVQGPNGIPASFTHWSFGQLCSLGGVPAGYIRSSRMPGALAADNINWGLHHSRQVEDVSVAIRRGFRDGDKPLTLSAVNGPNYGVLWNADIADALVRHFHGDPNWGIPVPFNATGAANEASLEDTTLYASDRDMWVFLADTNRKIEVPNRRNGEPGSLSRGFYVGNSETGASKFVLGMFLFDYMCCNHIIWGAQGFQEISFKHTSGAPFRWLEEVKPMLAEFANSSPKGIEEHIAAARQAKIKADVEEFLASRFGKGAAAPIMAAHLLEEQRPVETLWDATVGATAYAKRLEHVDARVSVEREAGKLLQLAA